MSLCPAVPVASPFAFCACVFFPTPICALSILFGSCFGDSAQVRRLVAAVGRLRSLFSSRSTAHAICAFTLVMGWVEATVANLAPLFIVLSPIISYSDQAVSMHRNKSSAGFSLDITLIMLVASFLRYDVRPRSPVPTENSLLTRRIRVFYWPGAHFDASLLIQSIVMIFMQAALLKVGLDHRPLPSTKGGEASLPFASLQQASMWESRRPYNFWQWRSPKP